MKAATSLRLDITLAEDLSSVCRICNQRYREKPLAQLEVYKCFSESKVPQHVATSFYCIDCYNFVYSFRKQLTFKLPSFLGLLYNLPTIVAAPLASDAKLFNLLKSCCPAEELQQYISSL